ncbi:HAD hydrolase family protein [Tenacibaculum discolor]|uniref:HAD hydrolase family protein n=1 Tax=Tenacibaculum discolor TaxID=361581 RepID=UPI003F7AAA23
MELSNKQLKKILFILIIIFQVVLFSTMAYNELFVNTKEKSYEKIKTMLKEQSFAGIITKKTRDKNNHNNALVIFDNGKKLVLFEQTYSQLEVNDSIVKKQNDLHIEVYRKGIKKIINLNEILDYYK